MRKNMRLPLLFILLFFAYFDLLSQELTLIGSYRDSDGGINGLNGAKSITVAPDGRHVYIVGEFDDAVAIFERNTTSGVLTFIAVQKNGEDGIDGLIRPQAVTVSPDNDHVYIVSSRGNILVFHRDINEGFLSFVEVHKQGESGIDGLNGANSVAVSYDGNYVYTTASISWAVAVFMRNKSTGGLTFIQVLKDNEGGIERNTLRGANALTISSDDNHIYVTGGNSFAYGRYAAFSRNKSTGLLTLIERMEDPFPDIATSVSISGDGRSVYVTAKFSFDSDETAVAFNRNQSTGRLTILPTVQQVLTTGVKSLKSVTISPDGKNVCFVSSNGFVTNLSRNTATGQLGQTYIETFTNGEGIDGLQGLSSVTFSPNDKNLYVTSANEDAVLTFDRSTVDGRLAFMDTKYDDDGGISGLDGANSITVSPDGNHIYATGESDNAVAAFDRNNSTGLLTFLEAHKDGKSGVKGLRSAESVAISTDGKHLYVGGVFVGDNRLDDAVTVFSRNLVTGRLTYVESINQTQVFFLNSNSIILSPDGGSVYSLGGSGSGSTIAVFSRDSATGRLVFVELVREGFNGVRDLSGVNSAVVTPDGRHLYATAGSDKAVSVFNRNITTGQLTLIEVHKDGLNGIDGLDGANSVTISTDGGYVYVLANGDNSITTFRRDTFSGTLHFVEVLKDSLNGITGLNSPKSLAVSSAGDRVYVTASAEHALVVFARDPSTGRLAFIETVRDGDNGVNYLDGVESVILSPDDRYLYAVASTSDAITAFSTSSTVSVSETKAGVGRFILQAAYPNPFNPETTIKYQLSKTSNVKLTIYNLAGQEVKTLIDSAIPAGLHVVRWNGTDERGRNVASGIYLYRLETRGRVDVKKMTLLR